MDTELETIPQDNVLVAFSPGDLKNCQVKLSDWCKKKIAALRVEYKDLKQNYDIAKKSKWRTSGFSTAMSRTKRRMEFYKKIEAAVAEGYILIPPFPVDTFAIRVQRESPAGKVLENNYSSGHNQKSELPPVGEGRYVSPTPLLDQDSHQDDKGKTVKEYWASNFMDVAFPVVLAKSTILTATHKAMALNIFDEIGLVGEHKKKDPIVVGSVLFREGYNTKRVNFFISWWLNPNTL